MALRRPPVADETVRSRSSDIDHDGRHVPTMACQAAYWGVVLEHGVLGLDWVILRNGHLPADTVLCDGLYGTAGSVAVSESV